METKPWPARRSDCSPIPYASGPPGEVSPRAARRLRANTQMRINLGGSCQKSDDSPHFAAEKNREGFRLEPKLHILVAPRILEGISL